MRRPRFPLYRFTGVVLLCAAALIPVGCSRSDAATEVDPATTGACVRAEFSQRTVLTGELQAVESTKITVPRTPMWTIRISWMIDDGAEVSRGDKILEFDNSAFTENLDEKRIAVDRAVRNLEQEKARAETALIDAQLRLERARIALAKAQLSASVPEHLLSRKKHQENLIALHRAENEYQKALEDMKSTEKTSETEVRVREIELGKAQREVEVAESAIDDLVITAPEDGIVIVAMHPWEGRKFKEGDSPWVGLTVLKIPKLDRMAVRANLFDVDDGRIEAGQSITCTLDSYPELEFSGRIRDITPIAQEVGNSSLRRAFTVNIDLDQSNAQRMRPGMSARIEARRNLPGTHLLAPRWSVEIGPETARVHRADGSWQRVEIGPCSAQFCVIRDGLEEGVELMPTWSQQS